MNRIHLLPDDLINKIAAGEVIERPASVVKELVENSLDAGAKRIEIEVQNGGKKLIRVTDDGAGMTKEDLPLAISRHATSKINALDDLFNLSTLGFRGEALPSIASVSKMEILACPANQAGGRIAIDGGKQEKLEDFSGRGGTSITVRDLFFNVPARRKFLKSDATELSQIVDLISRFILAHPSVVFTFIQDGNVAMNSSGSGKLEDAVISVYGIEVSNQLLSVNLIQEGKTGPGGTIQIFGLISNPQYHRSERSAETFIVNGRWIRNAILARELERAYETIIPRGRYPLAVLNILINPALVDINVHPSKREVRFVRLDAVLALLRQAVQEKIGAPMDGSSVLGGNFTNSVFPGSFGGSQSNFLGNAQMTDYRPILEVSGVLPVVPLYQLKASYIVVTDGETLQVIDQHAAHERILYEKIKNAKTTAPESQPLLIPENLELELTLADALRANLPELKSLGFEIEEFGGNTLLIRAIPATVSRTSPRKLLQDLAGELAEDSSGKARTLEAKQEKLYMSLACHAAIKAGEALNNQEISALIRDLFQTTSPYTCPHGRPTIVKIDELELKKRFSR